ncbi:MAG: M48 family metalloprotease [Candidatus Hermodarchaeota archaeon]
MKKNIRFFLLISYPIYTIGVFLILNVFIFQFNFSTLIVDWTFLATFILYLLTIEELYQWAKNGKRSEMSDIVAILFFFFLIFFFSKDFLTSIMGAFSIYLWIGIYELKDYPVINKILIISLITYNIIFIAGLFSYYLNDPIYINTSFAFSFWIILILGFLLFGRKYIIVWRFMSPEYLTLFLYIIAWLAVVFINQYTPLNFITNEPINWGAFNILDFFLNIYFLLIIANWLIYFISGFILDKLLGICRVKEETLLKLVDNIKTDIGIKSKVKVGFGKYPILNAMAYGSIFDKRIAIIAEDINELPKDELKGIVAHELAHTKGKHTLILTLITSIDLIVRMLLGIPATFYDYTFGNPQIPLILFFLLNLGIYFILFIFVRILEGKADLKTKEVGYANELAKALYNLESFYATGREIGLNTMLLAEEKITDDNKLLNYVNTAKYLNKSMIKPSRASLLASFINSHPPSYYRIAAILDNKLKPGKEAILPFICMKKSNQRKYALKFQKARENFKVIATQRFKETFNIEDISLFMEKIRRKELYRFDLQKDYLFKNLIKNDFIIGKLIDIEFTHDITDPEKFYIRNLSTDNNLYLNSSEYSLTLFNINDQYFFNKDDPITLINIELPSGKNEGFYVFTDKNEKQIQKPIHKTKLPKPISFIKNLKDSEIFLKTKGVIKIYNCINVIPTTELTNYQIEISDIQHQEKILKYTLSELIIKPRNIYLSISKSQNFRETEINLIKWLSKKQLIAYIYLKKPVNNLEIGYVQEISTALDHNKSKTSVFFSNIFGKEIKIPFQEIELIQFEYKTGLIQFKSETSLSSRLGFRILKKFKPERIIIA